jgi:hypothetical protein
MPIASTEILVALAGSMLDRPDGGQTHYSAQPQGLAPLLEWISLYSAFWRDRFETLLNRMDQ